MRKVRYAVAASLDGYIAGPNGEYDWIVMDPDIDFEELTAGFDTVLMGRKTWEMTRRHGGGLDMPGMEIHVFSRTLRSNDCPGAPVSDDAVAKVRELKRADGGDIWLFGGGALFRSLLQASLVNTVEVALIPVLLGAGVPLLPAPASRTSLRLVRHRVYEKTGTVSLEYAAR